MKKATTHDELVFEALAEHRNVGADPRAVRKHVAWRERRKSGVKHDRESLRKLEQAGDAVQVGARWFLTPQGAGRAKGNAISAGWEQGDATMLLAVAVSCGDEGADLSQIIGAVDYIDRSIPTLEQLHGALNRLASGRLIKRRAGRLTVTEKGTELWEKVKGCCRRSIQSQRRGLTFLLDCPCCGVQLNKVQWSILLDQAAVDDAVERYRRRMG